MKKEKQQPKINVERLKRNALKNIPSEIKRLIIGKTKGEINKNTHDILMEMRYGKD